MKAAAIEQADRRSGGRSGGAHATLKKLKRRKERRRARIDPECVVGYGKYRGYES